jgi:hypothetical protein
MRPAHLIFRPSRARLGRLPRKFGDDRRSTRRAATREGAVQQQQQRRWARGGGGGGGSTVELKTGLLVHQWVRCRPILTSIPPPPTPAVCRIKFCNNAYHRMMQQTFSRGKEYERFFVPLFFASSLRARLPLCVPTQRMTEVETLPLKQSS